jgi:hypothetical protein
MRIIINTTTQVSSDHSLNGDRDNASMLCFSRTKEEETSRRICFHSPLNLPDACCDVLTLRGEMRCTACTKIDLNCIYNYLLSVFREDIADDLRVLIGDLLILLNANASQKVI